MALKSVVLPAPFGPMMPRRSPWRTWRLTSRTAVRPPKRFVTRSSVSTSSPGSEAPGEADQSLGGEAHHEDEGRAVDDEVDPGEPRLEARECRAQVRLERRDQDRAEEGAEGGAQTADDRVQREPDREVDREDVEGVHEADVLRPQRAADRRQRGAERHREDFQSAARDAERPDAGAERDRDALRAGREAAPAAGADQEHLRERDRGEREVWAAETVRKVADRPAGGEREHDPEDQPEPRALLEARSHQGRGVGADSEECGVTERDLAGIAAGHVPGGRERTPHEDQDQAVEDEGVADDEWRECGDAEEDRGGPTAGRKRHHQTPSVSAPR